jgi:high affinity Mn2+ porin
MKSGDLEPRRQRHQGVRALVAALRIAAAAGPAQARNPEEPENAPPAGTTSTFLDHSKTLPWWFSAEVNSIAQFKFPFNESYSGPNSFRANSEGAISGLFTAFFAYSPQRTMEFILDGEMAVGGGLSSALGLGGYTNLDVVRNPSLSQEPYLARVEWHQLIPLSSTWEVNDDRGPISSMPFVPRHRLELRVGKMSMADLFDINPAGSDSHLQFMNWTVDNNGAWDYAADTRGYTYAAVIEYQGPRLEVRFAEALLPTVANGIELDWKLSVSHAENLEVELKYWRRPGWFGTLRVLGFANHANMGSYREAVVAVRDGLETRPDITLHRHPGSAKYGFGLNLIQELGGVVRLFARGGWNDGANESWAYTEVDNTFEIGADMRGKPWHRDDDKVGLALVTNGLSGPHREYLQLGGVGFLLGDGALDYARETILEQYYNMQIWRGLSMAEDVQLIANPGYNRARGPAWVISMRGHLEF